MMYPYGGFYDSQYLIYLLPGLLLGLYAQAKVKGAFSRYSKVKTARGITGRDAAREILDRNGLSNIPIESVPGSMTDHYDPGSKVLRLSQTVYNVDSVAAVAVAAHEAGHALQDADHYAALKIRNFLVPAAQLGSNAAFFLILAGLVFSVTLMNLGIALFSIAVIFQAVTLPVEFNASHRAEVALAQGYLNDEEMVGTKRVLSAAALTYVAALVSSLGTLFRLLALANRRQ